ncbi:MAG: DUF4230 domain-containing protein [Actinobacteria bacterium]|nr:DUF4230 domain-containing protein [Actinomycetota bacterium]
MTGRRIAAVITFLVAAMLVLSLWLGFRFIRSGFGLFDTGRGEYTESGTTVVESIRELSELTTIEVVEAVTLEKGNDAGVLNFLRGDRISLLAVARIGAGVDLGEVEEGDATIDFDLRSIELRVPPPRITFVSLDNDATQVYDRDTGLLTRGDPQLESEARRAAEDLLERRALEAGILDQARSATRTRLEAFLRGLGFEEVRIIVEE